MNNNIYKVAGVVSGAGDLFYSTVRYQLWVGLALHDVKQRYRRSVLGPFWFVLSNIIFVSVLGVLYSKLFAQDVSYYIPFLTVGIIVWQFVSITANEGANIMIEAGHLIRQINTPISVFCHRAALRNFLILAHNIPTLLIVPLLFGISLHWHCILLPIVFVLYYVNGFCLTVILGVLGSRFRDIQPLMQNLTMVTFFFTPIMWVPSSLGQRASLVEMNPIYHFIQVTRAPLMGLPIPNSSLLVVVLFSAVLLLSAQITMQKFKHRIVYWL